MDRKTEATQLDAWAAMLTKAWTGNGHHPSDAERAVVDGLRRQADRLRSEESK